MDHGLMGGLFCLLLLVSLAGFCIADEAPGYSVYIQGGELSMTEDADGLMLVTIQDVVPYICLEFEKGDRLLPISDVTIFQFPLNAALVFSGTDGDSISLIQISNLSLSDDNKDLTLQINPLEFYEGEMLKGYAHDAIAIEKINTETHKSIGVYMEVPAQTPSNIRVGCYYESNCIYKCVGYIGYYC